MRVVSDGDLKKGRESPDRYPLHIGQRIWQQSRLTVQMAAAQEMYSAHAAPLACTGLVSKPSAEGTTNRMFALITPAIDPLSSSCRGLVYGPSLAYLAQKYSLCFTVIVIHYSAFHHKVSSDIIRNNHETWKCQRWRPRVRLYHVLYMNSVV